MSFTDLLHEQKMYVNRKRNYIIPGLTSTLIYDKGKEGKLRLFQMNRVQEFIITPHNHRFDLFCQVLFGKVDNIVYEITPTTTKSATHATFAFEKEINYEQPQWVIATPKVKTYSKGDFYFMKAKDYHSITFSKNAEVLFFEGPEKQPISRFLVPYSNGRLCTTMHVFDWMQEDY